MNDIQFKIGDDGRGTFFIDQNGERLAEMEIGISSGNLTAYHTQVSEKLQGQGIANKLLTSMVEYAKEHKLKVIPLCPFVHAQFNKHPEQYADIWNKNWH